MWLLSRKRNEYNEVYKHKARWVTFGNHQEYKKHWETYALVGRNESLKVLLSLAVNKNMQVCQFDVETAFLYGEIDAPVYVRQVQGFKEPSKENWVWKLKAGSALLEGPFGKDTQLYWHVSA